MTDYSKLVKALLSASTVSTAWEKLMRDAATAIEALQARLGEAENSVERWKDMYLTKQLPKRGKWIDDEFGAKCSYCEKYAYWSKYEIPWKSPYCPLCGAKMEVHE